MAQCSLCEIHGHSLVSFVALNSCHGGKYCTRSSLKSNCNLQNIIMLPKDGAYVGNIPRYKGDATLAYHYADVCGQNAQ